MRPIYLSKALTAASPTAVCTAQALSAAGNLAIDGLAAVGGVATLDTQRRILLTSGGDDHLRTATIWGTIEGGSAIKEEVTLASGGTAVTTHDFLIVTRVYVDGAIATTLAVGTNGVGSTPWIMPNFHLAYMELQVLTQVSGSVTYNVEQTLDDFWSPIWPAPTIRFVPYLEAATAAAQVGMQAPMTGFRVTVSSGTGLVTAEALQSGVVDFG